MAILINILLVILSFALLILVHEFGHFIVAKLTKIPVKEFSIGFGPKIVKIKRKETTYGIGILLPLGGYVKPVGLDRLELLLLDENEKTQWKLQPLWKRVATAVAGPVMNLILPVFLFAIVFMMGLPASSTKIEKVVPKSPAESVGIKPGDKLISVNGKKIESVDEAIKIINAQPEKEIEVAVNRNGKELKLYPTVSRQNPDKVGRIGIQFGTEIIKEPPLRAFYSGFNEVIKVIKLIYTRLRDAIFKKEKLPYPLAGPIGVVKFTYLFAQQGGRQLLIFLALFSLGLAIINLLPIPPLDGGLIALWIIEKIKRKPISLERLQLARTVGISLLILLVALGTYYDIFYIIHPLNFP